MTTEDPCCSSNHKIRKIIMITVRNLTDNSNLKVLARKGCFMIFEHQKDLSVAPGSAQAAFFMHQMNCRKRQVLCELSGTTVKTQAGAMQWISGNVESVTGVSGVGGFLKGVVKGALTGETAVKPNYTGTGYVMLEPTFRYILLENVEDWGPKGMVVNDGMFLACEASVSDKVVMRNNLSSVFAGQGLFNLSLVGSGCVALESSTPREELIEFEMKDDVVKIDGNMAVAWSGSLEFTMERSSKSLIGSMVNGEGLVSVFRGTGKILMAPTPDGSSMETSKGPDEKETAKGVAVLSKLGKLVK